MYFKHYSFQFCNMCIAVLVQKLQNDIAVLDCYKNNGIANHNNVEHKKNNNEHYDPIFFGKFRIA